MSSPKTKLAFVVVVVAGLATVVTLERVANHRLLLKLATLESQTDELKSRLDLALQAASSQTNTDELTRLRGEHAELLRLRGEVSRLRSVQAETVKLQAEVTRLRTAQASQPVNARPSEPADEAKEALKEAAKNLAIAKMKYSRGWGMAFAAFAQANGDKMPETFEQAAAYFPKELVADLAGFAPDAFEIVYRGTMKEIANPATTIVFREKMPVAKQWEPGYVRTYLFADGHTEVKATSDGNFEQWEKERMVPAPQP